MSLFDKLKNAATSTVGEKVQEFAKKTIESVDLRVVVPENYLLNLLNKAKPETITNLSIVYTEDAILVAGKAKKALVKIPFEVILKPFNSSGRTIELSVDRVSPLDIGWINKHIFNAPPALSFDDRKISIDLNGIAAIAKLPVGKIKAFGIENKQLWVTIGL